MKPAEFTQLTHQLANWTREVIEHGRTPFRLAETYPTLWTSEGELTPPLVLWVNRRSLQAGGVILFSQADDATDRSGCACAHALGLSHYVEWGSHEILFWQCHQDEAAEIVDRIKVSANSLPDFQHLLINVLDKLKVFAITGAMTPSQLPAEYLVNLCRLLMEQQQALLEPCRVHLAEHPEIALWIQADRLAAYLAATSMLRLMILNTIDALPTGVVPERLERAIDIAQAQVPKEMVPTQRNPFPLPLLTHAFCVDLHGFNRRLEQIGWRQDAERSALALQQLWPWLLEQLDAATDDLSSGACTIEPGTALESLAEVEISMWPALLLGRSLWRHLSNSPLCPQQWTGPLEWVKAGTLMQINLRDRNMSPTRQQHPGLLAQLRTVWPGRRLTLAAGTPVDAFRLLYVMGQTEDDTSVEITLPADWPGKDWWKPIGMLLKEVFVIQKLGLSPSGHLYLSITRTTSMAPLTEVATMQGSATLPWSLLQNAPTFAWTTLPRLTPALLDLLHNGRLIFLQPATTVTDDLTLYSQTRLARDQWRILCGAPLGLDQSLPSWPEGILIPSSEVVADLNAVPEAATDPETALATCLGLEDLPGLCGPISPIVGRKKKTKNDGLTVEQQLLQCITESGVPVFPDQYLYQIENQGLSDYAFTPPLTVEDSFFGQTQIVDSIGQRWSLSDDHAQALTLCAERGRSDVVLPDDPQVVQDLVSRYLSDLRTLYRQLERIALSGSQQPRQARRLLDRIWQEQHLPHPGRLSQSSE